MSIAIQVPIWVGDWASQAACTGQDPDALFVRGKAQHEAKAVCKTCPVLAECLAEALDNRTEFGVWGGMTERERRALLRKRPDITSWRIALRAGMQAHAKSA
jgi:WhiB family redox-sensing transcriptional regulator